MTTLTGKCTCGDIRFEADALMMRALCHCSICKAYHGRDFADFVVFRNKTFHETSQGHVTYTAHKQPPLLKRGTCDGCSAPILEKLFIPGLPDMMLIPSRWIDQQDALPDPSFHMFYNLRVQDAQDDLPKANGYLKSQLLFSRKLLPALLRRHG